MIKVMNIISDTNIGGAGRVLLNYLKYCDRSQFDTSVVLPRNSKLVEPLKALNLRLYEVDAIADKSLDIGAIKTLKRVIRQEKPDIVHTHGSLSGRIAGRQCGAVVIFTRHSAFATPSYRKRGPGRWLNKWINEHYADRIIAITDATTKNLTDGGVSPDMIDTIMNGVEPVERVSAEECRQLRAQYGLGENDVVFGILARIEDYKGHMDLLEAMNLLRNSGRTAHLIIAGTGSYEETVKARCHELGLDDLVIFAGFVDNVAPIMSILDLQLNASSVEACSIALLEGFSMGVPAVASTAGGNPFLIDDGVNGFLFDIGDYAALAQRLEQILDSKQLLEELGRGAKQVYLDRFTGQKFAARIEEIYRNTIEVRKHGN